MKKVISETIEKVKPYIYYDWEKYWENQPYHLTKAISEKIKQLN